MKLALALMFQNEAHWLKLHLPVMIQCLDVDGLVGIDGGSTDGGDDYIRSLGGIVAYRKFDWSFRDQGNFMIETAEELSYDAILRMDPDEVMFPADIARLKGALNQWKALRVPRYSFVPDRLHYDNRFYPDYQTRMWLLNKGVQYGPMNVHETLEASFSRLGWTEPIDIMRTTAHIFHYGLIAPQDERLWLKHENYRRIQAKEEVLSAVPDGFVVPTGFAKQPNEPFIMRQPLEPAVIGARAPFEEVTT